ncbi:urease accessory protein UreF [Bifidobacterium leontopitheci]|uniref:Urease accessory protein UreF n=1 Tax=Bifidobacterium leontopitheci TaxID=2650774 RepID=A0A6I1GEG9_9BIFI|nr:urease accessory UreF family protein [Bifidobacterium leontopitheci]KAB7789935.1 urease accessory protein UreF [Bifidobacterium leontopitheci]
MDVNETESRRLAMLQVCDSVFPVGAFALSNGMETFVQRDFLRRGADFEQYMKNYLEVAPYKEIGQMALAGRYGVEARESGGTVSGDTVSGSAVSNDAVSDDAASGERLERRLVELDELASALQSAREIREGSERMCTRLIKLVRQMDAADRAAGHTTWASATERASAAAAGSPLLDRYARLIGEGRCRGVHAIAMGLYAADHAPDVRDAAIMYGYSLLSALTMCAAKAIPLSQYAGQVALHDSFPRLVQAVDVAMMLEPDDLGISGAYLDIAAMQHETLYSRLYMS